MRDNLNLELYEKIYFAYLRKHPNLSRYVHSFYFKTEEIGFIFKIYKKYFDQYKEVPSNVQLWKILQGTALADKITKDQFKSILSVKLDEFGKDWLDKSFDTWVSSKTLESSMQDVIEFLRGVEINEDNYKGVVEKVKGIVNDRNTINFRFNMGLDFFNPEHHTQDEDINVIPIGFEAVDRVLGGGLGVGTITAFMGESNIGKSIFLTNIAANAVLSGHNTVFITAEMSDKKALKRLGANLLRVPMDKYNKFAKEPGLVKKKLSRLGQGLIPPGALFVKEYPTSQATVHDIDAYISELEETTGKKIKFVIIDYINILSNFRNPNSENTYLKIKNLAEDLRAIMQRRECIGVTVTQVNASGLGSSDLSLMNVSESKALIHTVDNLFGIIQTAEMHAEQKYWLKALKLRDSGGKFTKIGMDIDFDYMKITEDGEIIQADS